MPVLTECAIIKTQTQKWSERLWYLSVTPSVRPARRRESGWTKHKIVYELRDIKTANPACDELAAWHERSGLPLKKFFNTSGLLYKSMELKDKLPGMSEEEMLRLLAADGMLVKRPLLVGDNLVLVGFKETEWERALKAQ